MQFEIHCFGNGEILKGVLNAVSMCINGQDGSLFAALKHLGLIFGAFWAAIYAIYGDQVKVFTQWIIPMTIFSTLVFAPSTSVWIHDPMTRFHDKVDHVPYGLAFVAGMSSKIGHVMTEQIEKVFVMPDDLKYQKTGMIFGSNLMQQRFEIADSNISDNMKNFVCQCIVYDAMFGRKYTFQDLKQSDDIWSLVSANASPVRSILWWDPDTKTSSIITCQAAVTKFNSAFNKEISNAASIVGKKLFGKNALVDPKVEIFKYLPQGYGLLTDVSKSAPEIIKQNMMINAVKNGIRTRSAQLGNYAVTRAQLQQRSSYETLGAMAADMLPTMKAVLEAICYACFIFVLPLAMLPFGWRFIINWGQTLLWLQMWAPLYAILNYVMNMALASRVMSITSGAGITIANSASVAAMNADMAAMAGYLSMSIPFLSIALIKGVESFVHLSSHLGNVSQQAAGAGASEAVSGNISLGNYSEGNMQMGNRSMLQQSRMAKYQNGGVQISNDRSSVTSYSGGQQLIDITSSNLPISLNASESLVQQEMDSAALAQNRGMSFMSDSSRNSDQAFNALKSHVESINKGDNHASNETSSNDASFNKNCQDLYNLTKQVAKNNDMSESQAFESIVHGGAGISLGSPGGLLNFSAGISGNHRTSKGDNSTASDGRNASENNNASDSRQNTEGHGTNSQHSELSSTNKAFNDSFSKHVAHSIQQRESANKSFSEAQSHTEQAATIRNNATSINANMNQEFVDTLTRRYGAERTAKMLANPDQAQTLARQFMASKQYPAFSAPVSQRPEIRNMKPSDFATKEQIDNGKLPTIDGSNRSNKTFFSDFNNEKQNLSNVIDIHKTKVTEKIDKSRSLNTSNEKKMENAKKAFDQEQTYLKEHFQNMKNPPKPVVDENYVDPMAGTGLRGD